MPDRANVPQNDPILFWNGPAAARWVTEQDALDRMLEPFGRAALARAKVVSGERVVDVGCGCGATALALGAAVGPAGAVVGLDVSVPMVTRARERARELGQVSFIVGDASREKLAPPADLVFSRFGVMFFANPEAAFKNLAGLLRPGGRVAFVCWRALRENAWASVPFAAASSVLAQPPTPLDAAGPGPFAFAEQARVRGLLELAGFSSIAIEPYEHDIVLGDTLPAAVELAVQAGPATRLVSEMDDATRARALAAVGAAIAPHQKAGAYALGSAVWLVTARRPD